MEEGHKVAIEGAYNADIWAMPGRVETQACAKQIKLVNVGGDPAPVQFDLRGSLLDQAIGKPTACISRRVSQFFFEGRKRAFRKNETVNNRGADNTERDLLDARNRGVARRGDHARCRLRRDCS